MRNRRKRGGEETGEERRRKGMGKEGRPSTEGWGHEGKQKRMEREGREKENRSVKERGNEM